MEINKLIVTYARGLEPMRGIDIFVDAKKICLFTRESRSIIGDNKVNYGSNESQGGFGEWAQRELGVCDQGNFKPNLREAISKAAQDVRLALLLN